MINVVISITELQKKIDSAENILLYQPLPDEPNILNEVVIHEDKSIYYAPKNKSVDPVFFAKQITTRISGNVLMLIPGTKFDNLGNRQGHGGGWYDRLLEKAPGEWVKIGICKPDNYQAEPLANLKPWDQPMDYVVVIDDTID